jgi:uncharacterized pyridoxamine 5'-phosphate oxidase family protein|nr:MAG TPA_asm: hypothetical protein [Caudoviricetes sp.]
MKNKKELMNSISELKESLYIFTMQLEKAERENNININELITEQYPFNNDLYDQQDKIFDWLNNINEKLEEGK